MLKAHIKNEKTFQHCLASEAIMRALARRFGQDEELWGLAGLLHDLDYELVDGDPARHGAEARRILDEKGACPALGGVIEKHNAECLGQARESVFEHALTCAETITGMIVATALVYPDKKLSSVAPKSITKRMNTAHFARAVSRERIAECEKIGIPLAEFAALGLAAMLPIAAELGL